MSTLRERWAEFAGWLAAAGVIAIAIRPPRVNVLSELAPAVDGAVGAGVWLRLQALAVPPGLLWCAIVIAALAISATVFRPLRNIAPTLRMAAIVLGISAGVVAAIAGRPMWTAVAAGAMILGMVHGTARTPTWDPTRITRTLAPWIVVVAAVIRLWSLDSLPPGFGTHSTTHVTIAVVLLDGMRETVLGDEIPPRAWLFSGLPELWLDQHGPLAAVHAASFGLLGVGLVESRMTSALLGIATVWLVALCGTWLGDRWSGIAAAMLLALAPWHVAFSRGNDAEHVLSPLQAVLALGLLARALRHGGWLNWLATGFVMGLSSYIYAPNQLVPLAGMLIFLGVCVTAPAAVRRDRSRIAAAVVVAVAVSLPHLTAWARSTVPVPVPIRSSVETTPDGDYSLSRPDDLLPNLVESASQLFVSADGEWLVVPTGMIGPISAALWLLGLVVCLLGLRRAHTRPAGLTLLILLGIGLLPGVLSVWVFPRRLILAALAIELIAGVGLVTLMRAVLRHRPSSAAATVATVLIVLPLVTIHLATGTALYVNTVQIPESLMCTRLPAISRVVSDAVPEEHVVVAFGAHEPFRDIEDAIRIASAPAVRPLLAAGHRRDDLWQLVTYEDLAAVLDGLAASGTAIRLVVPSAEAGEPSHTVLEILEHRDVETPKPVFDERHDTVGWTWTIPP